MSTILIVDDDANLRESLAEILELEGFDCLTAATFKEGIQTARSKSPHAVVMDIQLPDSTGFQLCQELRKSSPHTTLILMSGRFLSSEEKRQGFDLGADEYLTKPFDPKELILRIRQLLKGHQGGDSKAR
ncbi:MAG: response regulator transcription factor [Elusimicrobia bacterium]|nr:response regulator transcription factor [Elusimicrobiota bacterium]